jgi:hypothetical protein
MAVSPPGNGINTGPASESPVDFNACPFMIAVLPTWL